MKHELDLDNLQQQIHAGLKAWHKADGGQSPFASLQLFQQWQTGSPREITNKILFEALETLRDQHNDLAELISRHFLDGDKMHLIARSRNIGEATAYRQQNEAVAQLARILERWEREARARHRITLLNRLERPTYIHLIGVQPHLEALLKVLLAPGPPWLVAIEGMGGLGKTSLADTLTRHVIDQRLFNDVGWVSSRRYDFNPGRGTVPIENPVLSVDHLVDKLVEQLLTDTPQRETFSRHEAFLALETQLKQHAHLVVIDNLETLVELETLLPTLRDLSNPTKFLLTSREKLPHEPGIYHFPLPELSEADTLRLIRHEVELRNPPYLQAAADEELHQIYQTVGGNPLAIRLVVGQTHLFSLKTVLADLPAARGTDVEALYSFIYGQAWNQLDETTRRAFLAMLLVADGQGSIEHLTELVEMEETDLRDAIATLVRLNLVDLQAEVDVPHYTIHNLTRTFLQEQVLRWM